MGHTVGLEQSIGHGFVHAHRACQHAAAHVGDAGQLQQALHRAILAPQAMEHRDDHIHMHFFHMAFRVNRIMPWSARSGLMTQAMLPASSSQLPSAIWRPWLGVQPAAILGDAHSEHLIFFTVNVVDEVAHRNAADLVLAGHTAEQQHNAHFFRLHDNSLLFTKPKTWAGYNR